MLRVSIPAIVFLLILGLSVSAEQAESDSIVKESNVLDFDTLWNYNEPTETRAKFMVALSEADKEADLSYYLQLQTQIARTYGLERLFESAHELLDEVEAQLTDDMPVVRVRYLLERGRTINSAGDPAKSKPLFEQAFYLADSIGADYYTIDAAHMIGIVGETQKEKMDWNLKGIDVAENSTDKRARHWLGSIYNNVGWTYHDHEEYDKALDMFERALAFRTEEGERSTIGIAKWCVARALRSLKRYGEAMEIQLALAAENKASGESDGFVWEELGELYLIKGDTALAAANFAKAYTALSKFDWIEADRLQRIKGLGLVDNK